MTTWCLSLPDGPHPLFLHPRLPARLGECSEPREANGPREAEEVKDRSPPGHGSLLCPSPPHPPHPLPTLVWGDGPGRTPLLLNPRRSPGGYCYYYYWAQGPIYFRQGQPTAQAPRPHTQLRSPRSRVSLNSRISLFNVWRVGCKVVYCICTYM